MGWCQPVPQKHQVKASKIGIIFSFAKTDPFESYLEQHLPTSTGYIDIAWNLVCDPGLYFDITVTEPRQQAAAVVLGCGVWSYEVVVRQQAGKTGGQGFQDDHRRFYAIAGTFQQLELSGLAYGSSRK